MSKSVRRWWDYTKAYQVMLEAIDTPSAPWHVVPADDKRRARLNLISHMLREIPYKTPELGGGILREQEAGAAVKEIARRHGVSEQSFYRWKAKYGGMEVSDARRLRDLEAENGKLKRLLAEAHLDNAALKDVLGRKW